MRSSDGLYKRGGIWWGWKRDYLGGPLKRASTKCRDRQAARFVKAEWERMAADPARRAASQTTLGQALAMYMDAQKQRGELSKETLETYDLHCRQLARTLDQDTPLAHIGHQSFKDHIKIREGEGTAPHTVGRELTRLLAVLVNAKNEGKLSRDLTGIKPRYARRYVPRKRALTVEELLGLGRNLRADRLAHVAFVVATGCRLKESYRATGAHLLDEGFVYLDGTKTERARRTIPIAPPLRPFLEFAIRNAPGAQELGKQHGEMTCPAGSGSNSATVRTGAIALESGSAASTSDRPLTEPGQDRPSPTLFPRWGNSRRDILAACKRAGIAPCTWNDLRRTNATLLAEAGVTADLGAKLLGHADSRMWTEVYANPRPVALKHALDAAFEEAPALEVQARPQPELLERFGPTYKPRQGLFRCGCGKTFEAYISNVRSGKITSCGCHRAKQQANNRRNNRPEIQPITIEPEAHTHSTELSRYGSVALTLAGVLAVNAPETYSLRSRRSVVRTHLGAQLLSNDSEALDQAEPSTESAGCAGERYIDDTAAFDPRKCDHGSEYAGHAEFTWCQNCQPLRWWLLDVSGRDLGMYGLRHELRILPAIDIHPDEIARDLAPRPRAS